MQILDKPNNNWKYVYTCNHCDHKLEASVEDIKHLGWYGYIRGDISEPDGDRFYLVCTVCMNSHELIDLPKAIMFQVPKHNEYS